MTMILLHRACEKSAELSAVKIQGRHRMNNSTIIAHLLYLVLSLGLTVWVARTLFQQGALFLQDAFGGDKEMTKGLGHLLQMGFYLLAFGFIFFLVASGGAARFGSGTIVEQVSTKVGIVLFICWLSASFRQYLQFCQNSAQGTPADYAGHTGHGGVSHACTDSTAGLPLISAHKYHVDALGWPDALSQWPCLFVPLAGQG